MRFADRGVLKAGMWADVVVFDPETIRDVATFENPNQLSEGMRFVLVNGVPVIDEGKMTNALPGKVLQFVEVTGHRIFNQLVARASALPRHLLKLRLHIGLRCTSIASAPSLRVRQPGVGCYA
jgi:hypothetical protein